MTDGQKVIKYLAIAFGIFLVVSIFSAIIFGFKVIYSIFSGKNSISEDFHNLEISETVENLQLDLAATNLIIKSGEEFKAETNNSDITVNEKDGKLVIKEKKRYFFLSSGKSELIIYIPEVVYKNVAIENGAGKVEVETLRTDNLELDLGAGLVVLKDVIVSNETKIDGGAGEIKITDASFYNLDLDLGVGKFEFDGDILGKSDIDAGVGEVNLDLFSDDYKIKVSKGVGTFKINDKAISDGENYGNGKNIIEIDGGVGSISISTKEAEIENEAKEFTKIYKLLNITEANEKKAYYLTLQDENEVETVLVKNLDKKLVSEKNYEFKFSKLNDFEDNIENIFANCEIVSIEEVK